MVVCNLFPSVNSTVRKRTKAKKPATTLCLKYRVNGSCLLYFEITRYSVNRWTVKSPTLQDPELGRSAQKRELSKSDSPRALIF